MSNCLSVCRYLFSSIVFSPISLRLPLQNPNLLTQKGVTITVKSSFKIRHQRLTHTHAHLVHVPPKRSDTNRAYISFEESTCYRHEHQQAFFKGTCFVAWFNGPSPWQICEEKVLLSGEKDIENKRCLMFSLFLSLFSFVLFLFCFCLFL